MPSQGMSVSEEQPDDFSQAVTTQQAYGKYVKDSVNTSGKIVNPSKSAIELLKTAIIGGMQGITAASKLPANAPPVAALVAGGAAGFGTQQLMAEQRARAMEIMTPAQLSPQLATAFPDLANIPWNISKPLIEIRMKQEDDSIGMNEAMLLAQYVKSRNPESEINPISFAGQSRKVVMPIMAQISTEANLNKRLLADKQKYEAMLSARKNLARIKDEMPIPNWLQEMAYYEYGEKPQNKGQLDLLLKMKNADMNSEYRYAMLMSNIFMPPEIRAGIQETVKQAETEKAIRKAGIQETVKQAETDKAIRKAEKLLAKRKISAW